jgi:predicted RNase H-like HicB family nuclease
MVERDGSGTWLVSVPSILGCHTYGRSISEATSRIPELLLPWDADPHDFDLRILVEPALRELVATVRRTRQRADLAEDRAREATIAAVRALTDAGYSRRDAARVLGVSHQRVHQLVESGGTSTPG